MFSFLVYYVLRSKFIYQIVNCLSAVELFHHDIYVESFMDTFQQTRISIAVIQNYTLL
jgi:hypothetical protein